MRSRGGRRQQQQQMKKQKVYHELNRLFAPEGGGGGQAGLRTRRRFIDESGYNRIPIGWRPSGWPWEEEGHPERNRTCP